MRSPLLLRGSDERRICGDLKNWVAPRISSRRNSERVVSEVCKGATRSSTGGGRAKNVAVTAASEGHLRG